MKKITHPIYQNYPEQPYISPDRDIVAWEKTPEKFPYGVVEKKQMERLPEGLLPGDVVLLWRIHFNNFTNETVIPQYFEYRYGINSTDSMNTLMNLGYVQRLGAKESVHLLNMTLLKRILQNHGLATKGKKEEVLLRINENLSEKQLDQELSLRRYQITPKGEKVLSKYDDIIQKHGPKM